MAEMIARQNGAVRAGRNDRIWAATQVLQTQFGIFLFIDRG
jgi:hypothetical protein